MPTPIGPRLGNRGLAAEPTVNVTTSRQAKILRLLKEMEASRGQLSSNRIFADDLFDQDLLREAKRQRLVSVLIDVYETKILLTRKGYAAIGATPPTPLLDALKKLRHFFGVFRR